MLKRSPCCTAETKAPFVVPFVADGNRSGGGSENFVEVSVVAHPATIKTLMITNPVPHTIPLEICFFMYPSINRQSAQYFCLISGAFSPVGRSSVGSDSSFLE